jgi:uncharacterized cupredoxin-like copper-binding protein
LRLIAQLRLAAMVLALAAPTARSEETVTLTVVMTEYKFVPELVQFQTGVRYRLHLENNGDKLHEFTAPEFFKTVEIANPSIMNGDRTEVVLQPHESKDLLLVPNKKGTYDLTCADHDWEGMVGKITVH